MTKLLDYAGAGTRLDPEKGLGLDHRRFAFQKKVDGAYVRVTTDRRGCIATLMLRSGEVVSTREADGLVGLALGLPDSVLHGELTSHTESGIRERQLLGYAAIHVFDASRMLGRSVAQLGYCERYGWLHRWQADVECYGEIPRGDWWNTDDEGNAHDPATGRFVRPVPRDLRRLPIVPLHRGKGAGEQLWASYVEREGGEGIVAVRLDAPLGAKNAKRKIKRSETLDVRIVEVGARAVRVEWRGHVFVVSAAKKAQLAVGEVWEMVADGWYETSVTPRFARLVRRRDDLAA